MPFLGSHPSWKVKCDEEYAGICVMAHDPECKNTAPWSMPIQGMVLMNAVFMISLPVNEKPHYLGWITPPSLVLLTRMSVKEMLGAITLLVLGRLVM